MITKQKANKPSYVTIGVTSFQKEVTNRQTTILVFILPYFPFSYNNLIPLRPPA